MAILLALVSALAYGLSDFVGGLVSRRASAWSVAVVVQVSSAGATALYAATQPGDMTGLHAAWAALAGVGSGAGVGFLFRGLASGRMSVVAPLSAVGAALLPLGIGLLAGERPGVLAMVGIMAALPGIWLVAHGEDEPVPDQRGRPGTSRDSGVVDGLLAGLGFGVMFAALGQIPESAGQWPLALTQAFSALAAAGLATLLRAAWWPRERSVWLAVPGGVLGALAVVAFVAATQRGLLTVTSVLASLYPAATVLLAMAVLRERIHRGQAVGLALCAVTVALVAAG